MEGNSLPFCPFLSLTFRFLCLRLLRLFLGPLWHLCSQEFLHIVLSLICEPCKLSYLVLFGFELSLFPRNNGTGACSCEYGQLFLGYPELFAEAADPG